MGYSPALSARIANNLFSFLYLLNIKLMSKILLVYDDFNELTAIDYSFKKVGFDVIALTNEFTIRDQIIAFNPDILICNGDSSRVSTLSIGKKVKEMTRWHGKSLLIFPKGFEIPANDLLKVRMDMMLEAPVPLTRLIQVSAKLLGHDDKLIMDKLINSFSSESLDQQGYLNQDENIKSAIEHIQGQLEKFNEENGNNSPAAHQGHKNDNALKGEKDSVVNDDSGVSIREDSGEGVNEGADKQEEKVEEKVEEEGVTKALDKIPDKSKAGEGTKPVRYSDPFQELMQELSSEGGKGPGSEASSSEAKQESIDKEFASKEVLDEAVDKYKDSIKKEIEAYQAKAAEKQKKYDELTQNTTLYPESMLKKVKVKKLFKELKKDWNQEDLKDQDELRKEFVKALFKK